MENRHNRTHPRFDREPKHLDHLKNIQVWRELTGLKHLRSNEQYWTLCCEPETTREPEDMLEICKPQQFFGVNDNAKVILAYREKYPGIPKSNLLIGSWQNVIREILLCPYGGLVYLDGQDQLDVKKPKASSLLVDTLRLSGPGTLVASNFCLDNPYCGFKRTDIRAFVERVAQGCWGIPVKWLEDETTDCYLPRKGGRTQMVTFFFWRIR